MSRICVGRYVQFVRHVSFDTQLSDKPSVTFSLQVDEYVQCRLCHHSCTIEKCVPRNRLRQPMDYFSRHPTSRKFIFVFFRITFRLKIVDRIDNAQAGNFHCRNFGCYPFDRVKE